MNDMINKAYSAIIRNDLLMLKKAIVTENINIREDNSFSGDSIFNNRFTLLRNSRSWIPKKLLISKTTPSNFHYLKTIQYIWFQTIINNCNWKLRVSKLRGHCKTNLVSWVNIMPYGSLLRKMVDNHLNYPLMKLRVLQELQ